ncbi:hypothetical protein ATN00_03080 [Sphingobium baderi]|uniref:Uncharacterized protein n=2 Tax=Sphingobium baderi TaxID=1332080 RepID=A0A0S3EVN8_9SPHN|nr:hypothetical protein ATN00_03080 [Sphingobium baderi]
MRAADDPNILFAAERRLTMRIGRRIAFAVAALAPMVLLQGAPQLTPQWFDHDLAGVPVVVWLAICWFALMVAASWVPLGEDDGV